MPLNFSWPGKSKLSVGVDLGLDSAKVVCLKSAKSGHQLIAHALLRHEQMGLLREFLHHPNLKNAEIRLAIQAPQLKISSLSVPIVPREELSAVVVWAFKEATGINVDEYIIRFYQTGIDTQAQKQNVLAFAIEKTFFAQWLKFVNDSGITNPQMAEPDICSLSNLVNYNYGLQETNRCVLIDIGKSQSQLAVVSPRGIEFFRPLSGVGSESLLNDISGELSMVPEDAERAVQQVGLGSMLPKQNEILDIVNSYREKFSVHAQYAIENYLKTNKDHPITNILLTGGGSKLTGLKEHIQNTLHFPTDLLDPFTRLDLRRFNSAELERSKSIYAVAAGLAL